MEIAVAGGYRVEPVTEQTFHKGYENEVMLTRRLEECWKSSRKERSIGLFCDFFHGTSGTVFFVEYLWGGKCSFYGAWVPIHIVELYYYYI